MVAAGAQRSKNAVVAAGGSRRGWRALATVVVALLVGVGLPALVQTLNALKVAGFPLGFYLAAQGIPIVLAILLFLHARRANRLDRRRASGTVRGNES